MEKGAMNWGTPGNAYSSGVWDGKDTIPSLGPPEGARICGDLGFGPVEAGGPAPTPSEIHFALLTSKLCENKFVLF